jgi:K+-transporting ATPase c subunit
MLFVFPGWLASGGGLDKSCQFDPAARQPEMIAACLQCPNSQFQNAVRMSKTAEPKA